MNECDRVRNVKLHLLSLENRYDGLIRLLTTSKRELEEAGLVDSDIYTDTLASLNSAIQLREELRPVRTQLEAL